jgi:hypothetical protein
MLGTSAVRCAVASWWWICEPETQRWRGLRSIALGEAEGGQVSCEWRYYITLLAGGGPPRGRGGARPLGYREPTPLGVNMIFREDDSRVRRDFAPANLATLRQFSLSLLLSHPAPK